MRDLLGEDDLAPVREACVRTFETRDTHAWPPELAVPASWADPYTAAIEEVQGAVPATVEAAADEVRAFIGEINAGTPTFSLRDAVDPLLGPPRLSSFNE